MAVYTEIGDEELRAFVAQYDIGQVSSLIAIAEGVENSNYLLITDRDRYILTIYEKRVRRDDLPFFLGLMTHLAARGVACPVPVAARDGVALREIAGKPAAMVTFLKGVWPRRVWPEHCQALGHALADLHLAGQDFTGARANDLSVASWRGLFAPVAGRADTVKAGLADEVGGEIAALPAAGSFETGSPAPLPSVPGSDDAADGPAPAPEAPSAPDAPEASAPEPDEPEETAALTGSAADNGTDAVADDGGETPAGTGQDGGTAAIDETTDPIALLEGPALEVNAAEFDRSGEGPLIAVVLNDAGSSSLSIRLIPLRI